ncbi:hypothetical protein D3C75_897480 [compost metagenome]
MLQREEFLLPGGNCENLELHVLLREIPVIGSYQRTFALGTFRTALPSHFNIRMAVHKTLQNISLARIKKFGQLGLMIFSCMGDPFPGLVHKLPFVRMKMPVNFILHLLSRKSGL